MHILSIDLKNFRNYRDAQRAFHSGRNLILGDNGRGKSNLLEAIHLLSTSKSFRRSPDSQLTHWEESGYVVRGLFQKEGIEYEIALEYDGQAKNLYINGNLEEKVSSIIGHVLTVLFSHQDVQTITGPPGDRRSLFDMILSTVDPLYFDSLKSYLRVLRQKNGALRGSRGGDLRVLESLNEQLCGFAGYILLSRRGMVDFTNSYMTSAPGFLGHFPSLPRLVHRSNVAGAAGSVDELREACRREIENRQDREIELEQAVVGPHRDDFIFEIDGVDARRFGSVGEARLLSIALRGAQAAFFAQEKKTQPILLLDDVLIELDDRNKNRILNLVRGDNQVLLTATSRAAAAGRDHEGISFDRVLEV